MRNTNKAILLFLCGLLISGLAIIRLLSKDTSYPRIFFLDVGQGDSELLVFAAGARVLVDAGPDRRAANGLEKLITSGYIDLVVLTHAEQDHFGGLTYILDKFDIGAIVWNGRPPVDPSNEWLTLMRQIEDRAIPMVRIRAGDRMNIGKDSINIISPDLNLLGSANLNDAALVQIVNISSSSILLLADAAEAAERKLLNEDLESEIVKISHHGSKYANSEDLLKRASPKIAVIEVGDNRYGHPAEETLARLSLIPYLFRTDLDGLIELIFEPSGIRVLTENMKSGYN